MTTLLNDLRGAGRRWLARLRPSPSPRRAADPARDGWPDPAQASPEAERCARRRPWFRVGPRLKWKKDWTR